MKKKQIIVVLIVFFIFLSSVFAETGQEIMQKVIDNQNADSSAMDISMNLIDANGESSSQHIQILTLNDNDITKTITLFLEPAKVRNTRFLTIENENGADNQWIYLPSLRKVKRIASGERDGSFMGSDFYYSDMSIGNIDDAVYSIIEEVVFNQKGCWVIESIPTEDSDSSYGRIVSWVDKSTFLTLKIEYYDKDNITQIKELTIEDVKKVDNHWSPGKTTMLTLDTQHKTVLEINQVKYDIPIDSRYFTTNFLQNGRL